MAVKINRKPLPKKNKVDPDKKNDWRYTGIEQNSENLINITNALNLANSQGNSDNEFSFTTADGGKVDYSFTDKNKKS